MFRVRIEGGPRNGEVIQLVAGKTLVLGRGRECDLRFPEDATMSRVQGELTFDGKAWTIHNKSQHGTLVSGARVDTNKVLTPGDLLVLGGTKLLYEEEDSAAVATLAPQPAKTKEMLAAAAAAQAKGDTPQPMPRDAIAGGDPGKETAVPAKPGDKAAAAGVPPAKPGAPGAKPALPGGKKSNKTIIIAIVALLFGCCCFGNIFWFVIYPRFILGR
ncbi:MAG: FHA domain-containing protein [Planctomycetota bacterium]